MISKGAVPEGLTLEQVNLEEVENHMAVVRQVDLKVEDVGIIHTRWSSHPTSWPLIVTNPSEVPNVILQLPPCSLHWNHLFT